MAQLPIEIVIWDLDGTLVNSIPATIDAFNAGLKPFLGKELTAEEIMAHFGPPDQEILRKLVGDKNFKESYALMFEHLQKNINKVGFFEGVLDAIHHNHSLGIATAIFTGRGRVTTKLILDNLDAYRYFDQVVTNDDVTNFKPHPEGLLKILNGKNISPHKAIMIGDSSADVKVGREAGTKTVGCTWSPYAAEFHGSKKPDFVAKHPKDFSQFLERLCGLTVKK